MKVDIWADNQMRHQLIATKHLVVNLWMRLDLAHEGKLLKPNYERFISNNIVTHCLSFLWTELYISHFCYGKKN